VLCHGRYGGRVENNNLCARVRRVPVEVPMRGGGGGGGGIEQLQ